jgi:hypothetical protein
MADMGQGTWAFRLCYFRGWLPAHSFELLGQNREAAPLGSLRFGTKKPPSGTRPGRGPGHRCSQSGTGALFPGCDRSVRK